LSDNPPPVLEVEGVLLVRDVAELPPARAADGALKLRFEMAEVRLSARCT
jgi:hypothetical protein